MSSIKETERSFLEEIENLEVHQNVMFNTDLIVTLDLIFTSNKIHVTDVHTLDSNDNLGKTFKQLSGRNLFQRRVILSYAS